MGWLLVESYRMSVYCISFIGLSTLDLTSVAAMAVWNSL